MFILPHGNRKDNIRSVIKDGRQRFSGHLTKGRGPLVSEAKGRNPLVTQAYLLYSHVCSPAVELRHKKGPRHKRKICANSHWLCSHDIQSSLSKNKNINYIFIYLLLYFDLRPGPKMLFQGDTPEGSDTFQWLVIKRDRMGGLKLMIWDKVKVALCHYSDAP